MDYVCISDNYWLGKNKPCLTYGLRGNAYFFVEVESSSKDLHSGCFGGAVHESMADLMYLLSDLVSADGKILIPGVQDTVRPLTDQELKLYETIDFSPGDYLKDTGCFKLIHQDKQNTLLHRWRFPTLTIHGKSGHARPGQAKPSHATLHYSSPSLTHLRTQLTSNALFH